MRSTIVLTRQAAITPIGTAMRIAKRSVTNISDRVGSMRWAIIEVTGRLVKIEVPRSPLRMCQSQSRNRTMNGRSSPRLARMRSISSREA